MSSAKRETTFLIMLEISLTYIRKRTGPKTEPWGTPDLTGVSTEVAEPTFTD